MGDVDTRLTLVGASCPVCGSRASRGQGTRDEAQIRCPRCGRFSITGTALSMLASHVEGDQLSRARASYAIRSTTSDENWLEIDSTSVEKLVCSSLPSLDQQIQNFLEWMSSGLGDDPTGVVQLPDNMDSLAGVVGAVDGERIEALMSAMDKEGLIERPSNNRVRITITGWKRLDQLPKHDFDGYSATPVVKGTASGSGSAEEAAFPLPEIIEAWCPRCNGDRKADVMARYIEGRPEYETLIDEGEVDVDVDDYRVLKCRGCDKVYVQRVRLKFISGADVDQYFDPATGEYSYAYAMTSYWPSPQVPGREPPLWLEKIQDQVLHSLFEEVYAALKAELLSLAAMGVRAALDRTFELAGADPAHGFAQKLSALEAQGVIAAKEKELLLTMTDAGSAAAHRGWKPEPEELDSILDTTEGLLQRVALLGPAAAEIRKRVPPRPKSPKN